MSVCRACGEDCERSPRGSNALEFLNLTEWPPWLEGLCLTCLYSLSSYVPDANAATAEHLNEFLTDRIKEMAYRIAKGKSVTRCEVLAGTPWIGDPDTRCKRYAGGCYEGRHVCSFCRRRLERGTKLAFIETSEFAARPFLIWASSRDDLMRQAVVLVGRSGDHTPAMSVTEAGNESSLKTSPDLFIEKPAPARQEVMKL